MGAVIYGYKQPNHLGAYVAHRNQINSAGRRIVATVVDVTGAYETATSAGKLKLAAEAVLVSGKTTIARLIPSLIRVGAGQVREVAEGLELDTVFFLHNQYNQR